MADNKKNSASEESNKGSADEAENQEENNNAEEGTENNQGQEGGEGGGGDGGDEHSKKIDYEAELEIARKGQRKAEDALEARKRRDKEGKGNRNDDEGNEDDDDNRTSILDGVRDIVEEGNKKLRTEVFGSQIKTEARKLAGSDAEGNLIVFHYENTINPTGDLTKDLQRAKMIANEGNILEREGEIAKTNQSKDGKNKNNSQSQRQGQEHKEPELSEGDAILLRDYTWDGARQQYNPPEGGKYALKLVNGKLEQVNAPQKSK